MRIDIRPATQADMPALRELVRLFPKQLVQRDLPRVSSFFVAETGGKLVGCAALQIYSKRIAEVRTLAVHPGYQSRKVATRLVAACCERATERGVKEVFAVTSQTAFFEQLGFSTFRRERTAMFWDPTPP